MAKTFFIPFLASGFGVGLIPFAPGTFGSLWSVALFYLLRSSPFLILFAVLLFLTIIAIPISTLAEEVWSKKDASAIVIDEICGQFLVYLFVPYTFLNLILGFVLFRFFDVLKLFPANWAQDNLSKGLGVVGDDMVAGLQAGIVLFIFHQLKNYYGS